MTTSDREAPTGGDHDDEPRMFVVMVAKPECMECSHLLGDSLGSRAHDCITETACPARYYRVRVGVPVHSYARKLADAMLKGDFSQVGTITAELEGLDPAIATKVSQLAAGRIRDMGE